jgi:hypothetical protein
MSPLWSICLCLCAAAASAGPNAEGKAYLEAKGKEADVVTLPSGLMCATP